MRIFASNYKDQANKINVGQVSSAFDYRFLKGNKTCRLPFKERVPVPVQSPPMSFENSVKCVEIK
jgi:hypothetical protein